MSSSGAISWQKKSEMAIENLRRQERYHRNLLSSDELFFKDQFRYTVRGKWVSSFEVFPWFIPPVPRHDRYRESLCQKRGESIDAVTNAVNFFFNDAFDEDDFVCLKEYYQLHRSPRRTLWTIVELKKFVEDSRSNRLKEGKVNDCSPSHHHL
jgi:hypothetical protein